MMWIRWTLPRLRIDQVMTMCLKYCVPLAAICFVGVLTWQVIGLPTPNHWIPLAESGEVREPWAESTDGGLKRHRDRYRPHRSGDGVEDRLGQRPHLRNRSPSAGTSISRG